MSIINGGSRLGFCRLWIELDEFPFLLQQHRQSDPDTRAIEAAAARLVTEDFPDIGVSAFVRAVCKWGNYAGVAGRVLRQNSIREIASALRDAQRLAAKDHIAEALGRIVDLKALGVSFGSKHLKFLDPHRAVVLDSVISNHLGYALTVDGYMEFLVDCSDIRDRVLAASVPFPFPQEGTWRVSDIEMAIYKKLEA